MVKSTRPSTYWRHLTEYIRSLVTLGLPLLLIASAQAAPSKNVLIIQQGTQTPFSALVTRELQKGFTSDPSVDVLLDVEYWDQWSFGEASRQASAMAIKYAGKKFDLIVSSGVGPFELLQESGSTLFPGVPVLVLMLSDLHKPMNGWPANFTGIVTHIDYAETIELATKLQPDLNHIYYVLGDSAADTRSMELVHQELRTFDGKLEVSYWEHDSLGQLLTKAGDLPPHSAILFDEFAKEPDGQTHTSARVCSLLSLTSRVPVYGVYPTMVGNGAVGGVMGSMEAIARRGVEIGISLLHGAKTSDFPVENSQSQVVIDWRQFERFHLPERQLPSSAIVLYRQPTVWQTYKRYIVGGISLCLAEALLIFGLMWQRARRRKVEKSLLGRLSFESLLSDLSTTFINLPEEQVDLNIENGLRRIAEFLKIDRVTLFEFSRDRTEITATFSWTGGGTSPAPALVKAADLPWWRSRLLRGEVALASDVNDLPEEALPEREYFLKMGIFSAATVPLKVGGEVNGAISFISGNRRVSWTEDLLNQVRVLGEVFWNALQRKHSMQALLASQAVLRESEADLTEAQRLAQVGSWRWDPKTDTVTWSEVLYRIAGIDPSMPAVSYKDHPKLYTAESWERLRAAVEEALRTGKPYELDLEMIRIDGARRWLVARGEAHRDASGDVVQLRGTVHDITERKRAEDALRETEERFRLVANTAPVMIWMSGLDRLCTYFNTPWLDFTGRSIESELGNGWAEGVHPEDFKTCLETYIKAFDCREKFGMEYRLRRHDGEYRWVSDIGVPRFNQDGSFAGFIGSCIDITERKLAEEALASVNRRLIEAQEKERTRIARELHDDVGQRLAILTIELEQLQQNSPDLSAEVHSRVGVLREQVSGVASDVQSLSHELHSSKLEYLGIVIAMRGFCREFSEQQKVEIEFKNDNLPSPLSPEISLCLFRVVQEALHNSAKYSGVRHFEVRLWGTSDEIHLTVSDSGAGFDVEGAKEGRGLGLVSMGERVKLLKGTLSIESQPKRGTTIHARVPLSSVSHSMRATG